MLFPSDITCQLPLSFVTPPTIVVSVKPRSSGGGSNVLCAENDCRAHTEWQMMRLVDGSRCSLWVDALKQTTTRRTMVAGGNRGVCTPGSNISFVKVTPRRGPLLAGIAWRINEHQRWDETTSSSNGRSMSFSMRYHIQSYGDNHGVIMHTEQAQFLGSLR